MSDTNTGLYVHYGAGRIAPKEWINFDASPTLRVQKIPLIGKWLAKKGQGFNFPEALLFGDIVKGLPLPNESCKAIYCAHVIEHLSREDALKALGNTWKLLAKGGVFRCTLPNMRVYAARYLERVESGDRDACHKLVREAGLGVEDSHDGWRGPLRRTFGNYMHLWMWDESSFEDALRQAGFTSIRPCSKGDASDPMFQLVEYESRFRDALAYECFKE